MQIDNHKTNDAGQTAGARDVGSGDLLCRIRDLADAITTADPQLRIVKNEEDDSDKPQREAATFVKLNGKRIGRDLELYNFMAEFESVPGVVARVLEELVLPIKKTAPAAFAAGIAQLRTFNVFGDKQTEWESLLTDLAA